MVPASRVTFSAQRASASPPTGAEGWSALVVGWRRATWLSTEGEIESLAPEEAATRAAGSPPLVCHAPASARRLGIAAFPALDLLELFAFVRPGQFVAPTPRALAVALSLAPPADPEAGCASLIRCAATLLSELAHDAAPERSAALASAMARGGWRWGPAVLQALGGKPASATGERKAVAVWDRLASWRDQSEPGERRDVAVGAEAARRRLVDLLGAEAEARPQQADYASAASLAFGSPGDGATPQLVLAEAGTGVGKTLGYIAPASLWAELNHAPVWISTFTRNLQRQVDGELTRLYPQPSMKAARVVVRKGRENYLCLLNLEEAAQRIALHPLEAAANGLIVRWAEASRDGALTGGDFPGWLTELFGRGRTLELGDQRGECIHAACPHYRCCFVESAIRKARSAEIVVANHALTMIQAALGGEEGGSPRRYVFDEGHHLFDAADGTFASHLTAGEMAELRRWILGGGRRSASRLRGLERRLGDLLPGEKDAQEALADALEATRRLPGEGWRARIAGAAPRGPAESFLEAVRTEVLAKCAATASTGYSLECPTLPLGGAVAPAGEALLVALIALASALVKLKRALDAKLAREGDELDPDQRRRIETLGRGLLRRVESQLTPWQAMLRGLGEAPPEDFVEWFGIERVEGQEYDLGYYRHWIDPTRPFAEAVLAPAEGALITSATLTDGSGDPERDWAAAEARCGTPHLQSFATRARVASPFDYGAQTRALVVTDVGRNDGEAIAKAYGDLFLATGGGALGLFTAITRLRSVQARLAPRLEAAGLTLYAQHVDELDPATLIEILRAEDKACLLGTDALRDGIDVPGRALRLLVFDRVPWPRPDLRHKARRARFGGRDYEERLTRLKLKQAFGRLIRRADDRGVFVLLDRALPSRLAGAFPDGVAPRRLTLAEAAEETGRFLAEGPPASA